MKSTRWVTPALSLAMLASTAAAVAQYYGPPPPPPGYGHGYDHDVDRDGDHDWERMPPEFRAAQQRGFQDGIEGARRDFQNHRRPNVNNRDEFRNPGFIPGPDRRDYRFGFERGYESAVRHMYGPEPR